MLRPIFFPDRNLHCPSPVSFIVPLSTKQDYQDAVAAMSTSWSLNVGLVKFPRNMLSPICLFGIIRSLRLGPWNNASATRVAPSLPKRCIPLTLVTTGPQIMKTHTCAEQMRCRLTTKSFVPLQSSSKDQEMWRVGFVILSSFLQLFYSFG
jgi:hypothetical protein